MIERQTRKTPNNNALESNREEILNLLGDDKAAAECMGEFIPDPQKLCDVESIAETAACTLDKGSEANFSTLCIAFDKGLCEPFTQETAQDCKDVINFEQWASNWEQGNALPTKSPTSIPQVNSGKEAALTGIGSAAALAAVAALVARRYARRNTLQERADEETIEFTTALDREVPSGIFV